MDFATPRHAEAAQAKRDVARLPEALRYIATLTDAELAAEVLAIVGNSSSWEALADSKPHRENNILALTIFRRHRNADAAARGTRDHGANHG